MAERPVFVPSLKGRRLVIEVPISFTWHPGMAASQKKKNVAALHEAAKGRGLNDLLEVSSKSDFEIGRRLSAFHQRIEVRNEMVSLESAFQGSKVFEHGGPYADIIGLDPRSAKKDERLQQSGRLTKFHLEGRDFPLNPPTVFYDWLYFTAISPARDWLKRLSKLDGFTDIEFNPERSVNCQARSLALFVALEKRGDLDRALSSFERLREIEADCFV